MPSLQSQHLHYSMSQESDLSLSSSSGDEDMHDNNRAANDLQRTYALNQTRSDPTRGVNLKTRNSSDDSTNLGSAHSDGILNAVQSGQTTDHDDREKLKIIGASSVEDYLSMPLPKNTRLFPSTSSLVSSSSEDVERKHGKVVGSKHRRQSSYRSVGSITSAGSAFLPEDKSKRWSSSGNDSENEPGKLPELVSFTGSSTKSSLLSSKKPSNEYRVPRDRSYYDHHKSQHVTLSDDQMNAWRSGMIRSDSYVSSSNGNASGQEVSPDRMSKNFENGSISNSSRHSKSNSSQISRNNSGIFVYSEDETDESTKYRDMARTGATSQVGRGRREGNVGVYDGTPQRGNYDYQRQWQQPSPYGSNSEIPHGLRQAPLPLSGCLMYYGKYSCSCLLHLNDNHSCLNSLSIITPTYIYYEPWMM